MSERADELLRENPDALLVAALSQRYPIATVPFLAELVEFVRCWEPPNERDQDGVCQYCLGIGCEKCDARFLARCRDEIVETLQRERGQDLRRWTPAGVVDILVEAGYLKIEEVRKPMGIPKRAAGDEGITPPYGEEPAWQEDGLPAPSKCADCGVPLGDRHWEACEVAWCLACNRQRFVCMHGLEGRRADLSDGREWADVRDDIRFLTLRRYQRP